MTEYTVSHRRAAAPVSATAAAAEISLRLRSLLLAGLVIADGFAIAALLATRVPY